MWLRTGRRGRGEMNIKVLTLVATAALGLVLTTISYTSSYLFSHLTSFQNFSSATLAGTVSKVLREGGESPPTESVELVSDSPKTSSFQNNAITSPADASGPVHITHLFSPYVVNDEFRLVSQTWLIAKTKAAALGINVEHICAVLPEDAKACPAFARQITLNKRIENYKNKGISVPTYGEFFQVLKTHGKGAIVMYSNADIATVPNYYIEVQQLMKHDLTNVEFQKTQLERARTVYFNRCKKLTVKVGSLAESTKIQQKNEMLCARDAVVYFENNGGRPAHHVFSLIRYFRNSSVTADEAMQTAYDANKPDSRVDGNAMTITRRQFAKADASLVLNELFTADGKDVNMEVLKRLFDEGDDHPGNDMFILPRKDIPRLLTETPFIHLRPSGFLIGQHLKEMPNLAWRRIVSRPTHMLTFHVGMGTDEWPVRADLQPRAVVFEMAHYFTRINGTEDAFNPPPWCQDANNYREYGTGEYCRHVPGDFCRGNTRLACVKYWHQASRDRLALNTNCYRISGRGRTLDFPICEFCNTMLGGESYRCTKKSAKECSTFPCT